jgi:hypothetical protein
MYGFISRPSKFHPVLHREIERNTDTVLFHRALTDAMFYEAAGQYEHAFLDGNFGGTAVRSCDLHQRRHKHLVDHRRVQHYTRRALRCLQIIVAADVAVRVQVYFLAVLGALNIDPAILDAEGKRQLVEIEGRGEAPSLGHDRGGQLRNFGVKCN